MIDVNVDFMYVRDTYTTKLFFEGEGEWTGVCFRKKYVGCIMKS